VGILREADPAAHRIREFRVWASRQTIDRLPVRREVVGIHVPMLDRALPWRLYWQVTRLPALARECDLLFVPGGNAPYRVTPLVTMCRNMLPFEWSEARRYGVSLETLRLLLLRLGQSRSFRRADGLIFLTRYTHDAVTRVARPRGAVRIIPHGIDEQFRAAPRPQRAIEDCSESRPFRLLYVSIIDHYKHQWHVAEAVARLRGRGIPVVLDFVGPAYPTALARLRSVLDRLDPRATYLRYRGPVPFEKLPDLYRGAELFVFASSCENMPNILVEAMAAATPIACAQRGPMPEILGDAGVYFDPERPDEIERALETLIGDVELRRRCAERAHERALGFSWERCARETLAFMAEIGAAAQAVRRTT
jgi:glycosyltransferase involved in cell wall biosynthesis